MKKMLFSALLLGCIGCETAFAEGRVTGKTWLQRSEQLMKSVQTCFAHDDSGLLSEYYPDNRTQKATYLVSDDKGGKRYSYLWPFSGSVSARAALYEAGKKAAGLRWLQHVTLPALDRYADSLRQPSGYASYLPTRPLADRFYDDNVWLGIDFADLYAVTGATAWLHRAEEVWRFVLSGEDARTGGGIYWCEQKRQSKNTCSNAPATVMALKLYQATGRRTYLEKGIALYEWTRRRLYDRKERLYSDHVNLDGSIGRAKFAYNSGQMLQAACLLYAATGEQDYLLQADTLAQACGQRFFRRTENGALRVKFDHIWFEAVMLRGYIEYGHHRDASEYIQGYALELDELWRQHREPSGLLSEQHRDGRRQRWLLAQTAYVEMMARLATVATR